MSDDDDDDHDDDDSNHIQDQKNIVQMKAFKHVIYVTIWTIAAHSWQLLYLLWSILTIVSIRWNIGSDSDMYLVLKTYLDPILASTNPMRSSGIVCFVSSNIYMACDIPTCNRQKQERRFTISVA